MKTTLTIEQSAELIKRGVSADKASKRVTRQVADSRGREIEKLRLKRWKDCVPYEKATMTNLHVGLMRFEHKEIFTLADLLSLLSQAERDLGGIMIDFDVERGKWASTYELSDYMAREDELIDSLYKLSLHLLDNHVKLD